MTSLKSARWAAVLGVVFCAAPSFAAITKVIDFNALNASQAGVDPDPSVSKYMSGTSAVGPNHIFHVKAGSMQICSKNGVCDSPIQVEQRMFRDNPFMVGACYDDLDYDAQVAYDSLADRWVVAATSRSTSTPGVCFAVSQTADPRGAYHRHFFLMEQYINGGRPTMRGMGVWPDGYYVSFGGFTNPLATLQTVASVFPRTEMLANTWPRPEPFHFNIDYTEQFGAPGHLTGKNIPPSYVKNHLFDISVVHIPDPEHGTRAIAQGISARKVVIDWSNRANSNVSSKITIPFNDSPQTGLACGVSVHGCLPQPSGVTLGTGVWLGYFNKPINYHNTGSGSGSFLIARSYDINEEHWPWHWEGIAWNELRVNSGNSQPFIHQQGKLWQPDSIDSHSRFGANLAMNKNGDIAVGYSHTGETVNASIRATGRLSSAAAGSMPEGEVTVNNATSALTDIRPASHWGPSTMTLDPDGCTFWYFGNYILSGDWSTRITSLALPGCNMAKGRPVSTSSNESSSLNGPKAVDGNTGTRWSSAHGSDPQWICVDLQSTTHFKKVVLRWEAAFARSFKIQTSTAGSSCTSGTSWTDRYSTTTGAGGNQTITLSNPAMARFVRMYGTQRATNFGYSLYEFEVYGQ
jgi:hypothetical protein